MDRQVGASRKVLLQQQVRVFVGAALQGTLRITEVDLNIRRYREVFVLGHLQSKKPSTLKFYRDVFGNHLKDSVGEIALRDFTTLDAQKLVDDIDRKKNLSHKSLQRIQTGLSAIFTLAKQSGSGEPGSRHEARTLRL